MIEIAGAVILKENKLLVLLKKSANHLQLPGGKVEVGESFEETMRREVKEEIGCEVDIIRPLDAFCFSHNGNMLKSHTFLVELKGEPFINEPEVFSEMLWIPLDDYSSYNIGLNVLNFCENYLKLLE